jgi:hypothetical protein
MVPRAVRWIASRSLSSGARSRDPVDRNDEVASLRATKQPDGQISKSCPAPREKIFRLTRRANQRYQLARLTRQEGRLAIVTNVRWDAVDAKAATDERSSTRTAKSCGPGAPVLALSFADHSVK